MSHILSPSQIFLTSKRAPRRTSLCKRIWKQQQSPNANFFARVASLDLFTSDRWQQTMTSSSPSLWHIPKMFTWPLMSLLSGTRGNFVCSGFVHKRAKSNTLCAARCQLTKELMERGSWGAQTREVAARDAKRWGLMPRCVNPHQSDFPVLNWHAGMFSGWCWDPLSYLTVFFMGRELSSNKGNQVRLRKKIQRSPSLLNICST